MKEFLNKNKKSIIFGAVTVIVLAAAFLIGGNNGRTDMPVESENEALQVSMQKSEDKPSLNNSAESIVSENKNNEKSNNELLIISDQSEKEDNKDFSDENSYTSLVESTVMDIEQEKENKVTDKQKTETQNEENTNNKTKTETQNKVNTTNKSKTEVQNKEDAANKSKTKVQNKENATNKSKTEVQNKGNETNKSKPETQNKENTTNKSKPETQNKENTTSESKSENEKQESSQSEKSQSETSKPVSQESDNYDNYCILSIICTTAINNGELEDKKRKLLPSDGNIINETRVNFNNGESVFDVLKKVCTENKIPFEFSITPMTNSVYIEGINNLYEFDCGSLSGWTYSINDIFPNLSCSEYKLSSGDKVEILYTCDLGADVGNYYRG